MDSKKLGMIAAAALTVIAAQANAQGKAPAAKAEEMVCASSCGNKCNGQTHDAKDKASCEKVKGTWMTKTKFNEKKKDTEGKAKADGHDHDHKH